jgi:hypothetical protein
MGPSSIDLPTEKIRVSKSDNLTLTDDGPSSIQGIAERARRATVWATDAEAALYAQGQPDGVIACRENGRHVYPATRLSLAEGPPFTEITEDGWYVRRLPCERCRTVNEDGTPGLPRVVRVEEWEIKHRRGLIVSAQIVRARPIPVKADYLNPPGQGRIKPTQIRNATVTAAVSGMRIKDLRDQVKEITREREREAAAAYERAQAAAEREANPLRIVGETA